MKTLLHLIEIGCLCWFSFCCLYFAVFALAGLFFRASKHKLKVDELPSMLLLIPAYREDRVIERTVEHCLKQNYPPNLLKVVVIADQFQEQTLNQLKPYPIEVLRVHFEQSTKSKAIQFALAEQALKKDLILILDADNQMAPDFLLEIAASFQAGNVAIQGHRTAKNRNTQVAYLDAISEEINNFIFCRAQQVLGLSSRLTGSGMAFEYELFEKLINSIHAIGGFDKELELKLLEQKIAIHYCPNARVLDEKVSRSQVLNKQRSRWISAQMHYFKRHFVSGLRAYLQHKNRDYLNKIVQLALLPRLIFLLFFAFGILVTCLFSFDLELQIWLGFFGLYVLAVILAFPKKMMGWPFVNMLFFLPWNLFKMTWTLTRIFNANKTFIHTPHES